MIIFAKDLGQNMLKITESIEDENTVKVSLDGRITNASFENLIDVYSRFRDGGNKSVVLDFSGVTYIDEDAATRVAKLRGDGVRIVNCSLFIETLLRSVE